MPVSLIGRAVQDLLSCLMLLTRFPVADLVITHVPVARLTWAFPLAGMAVIGFGLGAVRVAQWLHLPVALTAIAMIGMQVLATGALHEDGLADTADGFGGGRTRARKLDIMRDSRIGVFGAIALTAALAVRVIATMTILARPQAEAFNLLIAVGVSGRGAMLLPLAVLRPVRADGLAHELSSRSLRGLLIGAALTLAIAVLPPHGVVVAGLAGAAIGAVAMTVVMRGQIGGFTGDTLGATCMVAECLALTGMVAALTP